MIMNQKITLCMMVLMLAIPFSVAAQSSTSGGCPTLTRSLTIGASGADVTWVQQFLISDGYLTDGSASGQYDVDTQSAVRDWQVAHNIVASTDTINAGAGIVGPKTRAALFASCQADASSSNTTDATSVGLGNNGMTSGTQASNTSTATNIDTGLATIRKQCAIVSRPGPTCLGWRGVLGTSGCVSTFACIADASGATSADTSGTSGTTDSSSDSADTANYSESGATPSDTSSASDSGGTSVMTNSSGNGSGSVTSSFGGTANMTNASQSGSGSMMTSSGGTTPAASVSSSLGGSATQGGTYNSTTGAYMPTSGYSTYAGMVSGGTTGSGSSGTNNSVSDTNGSGSNGDTSSSGTTNSTGSSGTITNYTTSGSFPPGSYGGGVQGASCALEAAQSFTACPPLENCMGGGSYLTCHDGKWQTLSI